MVAVAEETFVYKTELDTKEATTQAKAWEKRLVELRKREAELTKQEQTQAKTIDHLRASLLKLGRAEMEGVRSKKELSKETRAIRQALAEETRAATLLRQQQAGLRRETQALRREEEAHRKAVERSAAAVQRYVRIAEQARARGMRADERRYAIYNKVGRADARIEELQAGVSDRQEVLDRQRSGLSGKDRVRALGRRAWDRYAIGQGSPYKRDKTGRFVDAEGNGVEFNKVMNEAAGRHTMRAISGTPRFAAQAVGVAGSIVGAGAGIVSQVAQVGAEREKIKAGLATALGSETEAKAAYEQIKVFAKETPFAVDEVAAAVTKLKVRGLEPTVDAATEALRVYGDVAGAMGKDLDTVIEAVSDASLGEFERLKEAFNVVGHKAGDELTLTFAGVTTTIHNDSKSITDYLKSIGKTNFSGGMAKQAATLGGVWSNLGDAVANFSEQIYNAGLGDALKEILGDIIGNVDGAENLAQVIGVQLADGVRAAYKWIKDLIGPTDELGAKIKKGAEIAGGFVEGVGKMIAVGAQLAETLGADAIAMGVFVAAAGAALGPLGALGAAAFLVGQAITSLFVDAEMHLDTLSAKASAIQSRAQVKALEEEVAAERAGLKASEETGAYIDSSFQRLVAERLRETGAASIEDLSKEEQTKLYKAKAYIARNSGDKAAVDALIGEVGGRADQKEFARLAGVSKKKRTPAQQKRLLELGKKLDKRVPGDGKKGAGGYKKSEHSAYENEQHAIIEKEAKDAGLRAGSEATLSGRGAEADALARAAEKETRDRLTAMAKRGEALPGEVDTAMMRIAGYNEVGNAPPPPVIVNNYQFKVDVPITVEGVQGSTEEFVATVGESLRASLEEIIFPEAALAIRSKTER